MKLRAILSMIFGLAVTLPSPFSSATEQTSEQLRNYCSSVWNASNARQRTEYVGRDLDQRIMEMIYRGQVNRLRRLNRQAARAARRHLLAKRTELQQALEAGQALSEDTAGLQEKQLLISREVGETLQRSRRRGGVSLGERWSSLGNEMVREEAVNASEFYRASRDYCLGDRRLVVTRDIYGRILGSGCVQNGRRRSRRVRQALAEITGTGPFKNVLEPTVRLGLNASTQQVSLSYVLTSCVTHYEGIKGWVRSRAYAPEIGEYLEQTNLVACVQTTLTSEDGQTVTKTRSAQNVTEAIQLANSESIRRNFEQLNGKLNQGSRWDGGYGYEPASHYCDWMEEFDRREAQVSTWEYRSRRARRRIRNVRATEI